MEDDRNKITEHLQERQEVHIGIKNGAKGSNIEQKGRCALSGKTLRHYVAKPYVEVAGNNLDCRIRAIV